jgi:hypothetical protein
MSSLTTDLEVAERLRRLTGQERELATLLLIVDKEFES